MSGRWTTQQQLQAALDRLDRTARLHQPPLVELIRRRMEAQELFQAAKRSGLDPSEPMLRVVEVDVILWCLQDQGDYDIGRFAGADFSPFDLIERGESGLLTFDGYADFLRRSTARKLVEGPEMAI